MVIQGSRSNLLMQAWDGLSQTHVDLVGLQNGQYVAAGFSDDPGLYFFVPRIAQLFHVSIVQAVDIFLLGSIILGTIIGGIGFWLLFKKPLSRIVSVFALATLALFAYTLISDIYVIAGAIVIGIFPWAILWAYRQTIGPITVFLLIISGFTCGLANMVRSQSGTAPIIIFVVVIMGAAIAKRAKLVLIGALTVGLAMALIGQGLLLHQRDTFLARNVKTSNSTSSGHPLWHSVYIGFGFLANPYGIIYLDEHAAQKVASIDPTAPYLSTRYAQILRSEVFRIVTDDPSFVFINIFAKLGVLLGYFIISVNFGLIACWFIRWKKSVMIGLGLALLFNSLFSLLVIPNLKYAYSFIAIAVIFGILSVGQWLESDNFTKPLIKSFYRFGKKGIQAN